MKDVWLGIDPGSTGGLGWAALDNHGGGGMPELLASGTITVPHIKGSRNHSKLWMALSSLLHSSFHRFSTGCRYRVAYEQVIRHSSVYAAHKYGGQVAMIQYWCAIHDVDFKVVHVMTVKKCLGCTASGKDKVQAMVAAAHKLGYTEVRDHNEADAVGIALGGMGWVRS